MRIALFAALVALLPLGAFAQTETAAPARESGGISSVALTVGVVGAVVAADILTKGALSGPALRFLGLQAAPGAAAPAAAAVAPAARIAAPVAAAVPAAAPAVAAPWWRFW